MKRCLSVGLTLANFCICGLVSSSLAQSPWKGYMPDPPWNGIVVLDVDYDSGKVTAARMFKSTGDRTFDAEAIKTFSTWQFKPKTVRKVKIPITFKAQQPRQW